MTKDDQFARAKAIAVLECMAIDLTGGLAGLSKTNPMVEVLEQRLEAIDIAQATLRKRQAVTDSHRFETVTNRNGLNRTESDTVKVVESDQFENEPCMWCDYFKSNKQMLISEGNGMYQEVICEFCPICGQKLPQE